MIEFTVRTYEGDAEVETVLQFEHSLRSISKWESKHCVAFLGSAEKTPTQLIDYYQCMLLTPGVDPNIVVMLEPSELDDLYNYINKPQTASSVPKEATKKFNPEVTTSELIYFMMDQLKINWEAQDWHLSRLMILIEITGYKLQPAKKRPIVETMDDWQAINEARQKKYKTTG